MSRARAAVALFVGMVMASGIAALSTRSVRSGIDHSVVRVSWRTPGIHIEECRRPSEEELEAVAPHMRRSEICEGRVADYELAVRVDGMAHVMDTVRSSGIRGDRPVYVFRDVTVRPGRHEVDVRFEALVPEGHDADGALLESAWSGAMELDPGQIGLVTLDPSGRALERRGAPDASR